MGTDVTRRSTSSRRAFLGGMAGVLGSRRLPSLAAGAPDVTVMTRNLYVGVDLFELFRAGSIDELRRKAGDLLEQTRTHPYSARMDAIAGEIAATRPDVVGIQEASILRTQQPSDFAINPFPNASDEAVDLLELLTSHLEARGLDYEVAATTVTSDVEVPAAVDEAEIDVRLTDRTALLVRRNIETTDVQTGTFDAAYSLTMKGVDLLSIQRGYSLVTLSIEGTEITVATTHLESADPDVRLAQARELLDRLPGDRPVVIAGDFNSGPGAPTAAYDLLTKSFDDTHRSLHAEADGDTCCHAPDLQNEDPRLSLRIDAILYRGGLKPTDIDRVGADPTERVTAQVNGESVRLWPSDHAGIVATFEAPTTATAPATPAAQTEPSPTTRTPTSAPLDGFGPLAAITAVTIGALARRYRRE